MTHQPSTLITGCSSGIGAALASELAQRGQRVIATARRPETLEPLAALGCQCLPMDVTDPASIQAVLDTAGPIHTLVNNAGYGQMGAIIDTTPAVLRAQFEANVVGPLNTIRAVAPAMMARRTGLIVNVGSISAILTTPFAGPYCASKAALHALNDALRIELAPWGVRVMLVRPGGVQSQFGQNASANLATTHDSPYTALAHGINKRVHSSQQDSSSTKAVARRIANAILAPDPPAILACGRGGLRYPALKRWLPTALLDHILARRFGLAQFKP